MTLQIFLVLALLVAVIVAFALERIPVEVTTLLLLCALVLLHLLPFEQAFSGFAREIAIVLASIFVLAGALIKTGVMDAFGDAIFRIAGRSKTKILLCLMPSTSFIAAFMHNTTTTAVFLPAVLGLCRKSGVKPGQVLIPFAFASMMGGTCMLLSSSTTIAASGYMKAQGLAPIGIFEFTPVGVTIVVIGIAYMLLIGSRLLPESGDSGLTEDYNIREFLSELVVTEGPFAGLSVRDSRLADLGLTVLAIHRGPQTLYPEPSLVLQAGDQLIVQTRREGLLAVKNKRGLDIVPDLELGDRDLIGGSLKVVEAIVMPHSLLIGRTLKQLDFRRRYGLTVIAVHRRGHPLTSRIGSLDLRVGDVLLLQGDAASFDTLGSGVDLWVLEDTVHRPASRRQRVLAISLFVAAVAVAALGLAPLGVAFLLAALCAVLLKLITAEEAYQYIHWRVIILIAGMTAFGTVMKTSGTAAYLANSIVSWGLPLGPPFIMLGFAILTMLLTQPMSNAAAALVILPVALSAATRLHIQPRTFGILVTLAAEISYLTPFEPSSLMVYGPGKYRFRDFLVTGAPLSLLLLVVLMLMVSWLWPLH
jgi:di/tricarboxylate transporter